MISLIVATGVVLILCVLGVAAWGIACEYAAGTPWNDDGDGDLIGALSRQPDLELARRYDRLFGAAETALR
jgi:hypothetical protein